MSKIRLTKEFTFEMAHSLHFYDGLCKNIHGHSYILQVTIIGTPCKEGNHSKLGMVMDFGELKRIVNENIISELDHSLMVSKTLDVRHLELLNEITERLIVVDYQPTCENMLIDFSEKIKNSLPSHVELYSIKLYETATSFAEWYADDNK